MTTKKQNPAGDSAGLSKQQDRGDKLLSASKFTAASVQNQEPNIFEAAAAHPGSITQRQLFRLDSLQHQIEDSDRYNEFREACGIPPYTPNRKLSKEQARCLIRVILAAQARELAAQAVELGGVILDPTIPTTRRMDDLEYSEDRTVEDD